MEKVRLGVIGTGRLGGFHASKAAANPEVDFIGVFDACESTRKKIASQYGVRDFSSLDELLPTVDAVVVATPSIYHAEVGVQILAAGKHLLMEKHGTLGLRGHHNQDAQQVGSKPRPRRVTDGHE